MKKIVCIIALLSMTGCTTLERQAVLEALRDYNPYTEYVWAEELGRGVWKVDEDALLQAVLQSE